MNRHTSIAVLLCAALVSSCDLFDENAVKDITGPMATARIKFNNFSPSSVGVDFFANDVKMSAVLSSSCTPLPTVDSLRTKCLAGGIQSTTGTTYGGNASGGIYQSIAPGSYTLTAKMAAKDTIVATVTQTIADGKSYSYFMSGIYNTTTKTAEAFVVEDPIPAAIDFTKAHVRFVNAISNGTGDLNLFATNTTTLIETQVGGATAYKAAGDFIQLDEGVYDFRVRYTGSSTNLITRTTVSLTGGRVYTLTARGSTATTSTLALDFTQNQR